jgi:uncharacterized protein YceH (UPF0502 family)
MIMPYNELELSAMTATCEEYIDIGDVAMRLHVDKRTAERLIEEYAKKLKKSRKWQGRKFLYLWADVLHCAKIHVGIENEGVPSASNTKAYMKQRIEELEAEVERLKKETSGGSEQHAAPSCNNPK